MPDIFLGTRNIAVNNIQMIPIFMALNCDGKKQYKEVKNKHNFFSHSFQGTFYSYGSELIADINLPEIVHVLPLN